MSQTRDATKRLENWNEFVSILIRFYDCALGKYIHLFARDLVEAITDSMAILIALFGIEFKQMMLECFGLRSLLTFNI